MFVSFNTIARCAYALQLWCLPLIDMALRLIVAVTNVHTNIKNTLEYCWCNSLPAHWSKSKQYFILLFSLKCNITISRQSHSLALIVLLILSLIKIYLSKVICIFREGFFNGVQWKRESIFGVKIVTFLKVQV